MNHVGHVNDYDQWAADANRGQNARLADAAGARAQAALAQRLRDVQTDDRYHSYYYIPRSDTRDNPYYYYYPVPQFACCLPFAPRD